MRFPVERPPNMYNIYDMGDIIGSKICVTVYEILSVKYRCVSDFINVLASNEEFSSPGSTFCADSYFGIRSTPCYRSST